MAVNSNVPLKLYDGNGNLQEMNDSAEENYLAYQAGLQLGEAADSSDVGNLSLLSGTDIGSYTDTFFNEAVGTHPGSAITSGSTVTTLYQRTGTATENTLFQPPIGYNNNGLYEMSDSDLNTLVDRLNGTIAANDYPGVFKLASSSPGVDWTATIDPVFTDTRTDGTSVPYQIYLRTTGTPPTAVRSVGIKYVGNDNTAGFDGLQEQPDATIKYTLGQRAKTRRAIPGNIGSYQLRSATDGAPTDPGTWRAVGTATDTKQTTSQQPYTGNYTDNFTSIFTGDFTGDYTRDFVGDFTGDYTRDTQTDFTGDFAGNYGSIFTGNYVGNYAGAYTRSRAQTFVGYFSASFLGNYIGDFVGDYVGNFQRWWVFNYVGNYTRFNSGYFSRPSYVGYNTVYYTGNYVGNYSRTRVTDYGSNSIGYYASLFTGNFIGNYTSISTRTRVSSYTSNSTQDFTGDFTGDFAGDFTSLTIDASFETIETYTLYVRTA